MKQNRSYQYLLTVGMLLFSGTLLLATPRLDSLKLALYQTTGEQERSTLYKKIADQFYNSNLDSVAHYYAFSLAAAEASPAYKDDIIILRSFAHLLGNRKNDYTQAKQYLEKAFQIARAKEDKVDLAVVKNDLGVMAKKGGDFQEAISCFFEAYKLIQQTQDDDVKMRILLSLGVIHNETSYNDKAIEYYKEAIPLAEKTGHQKMKGVLLNNLSKAYRDMEDLSTSGQYLEQALAVFDTLNDSYWKGLVLFNFGYNHFLQEEYQQAIGYYEAALDLNATTKIKDREVMLITSLSEVYAGLVQHSRAISYAEQGLELLKNIETTEYYPRLYAILGKCYQQIGDFQKSSYYLEQYIQAKQQKKEEDYTSTIGQLQAMHENELKMAAVQQLELQIIADEAEQQRTQLLFRLLAISFVLALAIFGLLFYRNKLKQTEKNYELRNQLARDLHDNIGSSLNQIKIVLGRFARRRSPEQTEIKTAQQLSNNILVNMYDLIWSLDKEKENVNDLLEYMRDHASNILSPLQIPFRIKVDNQDKNRTISAEVKSNIYSIYKEAINNIVKHTEPQEVLIQITAINRELRVLIQNDKRSLKSIVISSKSGLVNMKKRAELIQGKLDILNQDHQFIVDLTVKL